MGPAHPAPSCTPRCGRLARRCTPPSPSTPPAPATPRTRTSSTTTRSTACSATSPTGSAAGRPGERCADRHADAGDESAYVTAAAIRAEWQRVHDHTAETRAERYDPDDDTVLQHALRVDRHRQDVEACAREAAHQARQTTDVAPRRLAGTAAQPLYTALDRAGLHTLTDDDHQAVRDLTQHLDPATLRQVMSWLERTRSAAFALRGPGQERPGTARRTPRPVLTEPDPGQPDWRSGRPPTASPRPNAKRAGPVLAGRAQGAEGVSGPWRRAWR
ncbi:hypothetical protein [Kitasatospora sp. NPDC017646]|uniref:hypothetical protein n=1 Tax=Kitasatospora sp. NPDC017646 TaxID=3364024 RepID=UPI00379B8E72